jgi:predicted adenine nucleotide alpha hydrolase (AANH) superfamily ATPase
LSDKRLLLHVCCAPDATVPWPALLDEGFEVLGFFYGSNIYPADEWIRRRDAAARLAGALGSAIETHPYEPELWRDATRGMEDMPEGGARCSVCFQLQLSSAARYASDARCEYLCTTLTISPHKRSEVINGIGSRSAASYGLRWLPRIWRLNGGFARSVALSREMGLYRQNYCGCEYSIRRASDEVLTHEFSRNGRI